MTDRGTLLAGYRYLVCVVALSFGCSSGSEACRGPGPRCVVLATLTVTSSAGGQLIGVRATVSNQPLTCNETPTGAVCDGGGDGPLHVEAPGYQAVDVDSKVIETPGPECGCPGHERTPAAVTLVPN